jgi:hypothetical protein
MLAVDLREELTRGGTGCPTAREGNDGRYEIDPVPATTRMYYVFRCIAIGSARPGDNPVPLQNLRLLFGNHQLKTVGGRDAIARISYRLITAPPGTPADPGVSGIVTGGSSQSKRTLNEAARESPPAPVNTIEGLWDTNIPGTVRLQLEFQRAGNGWSGRFLGRNGWEAMADLVVDPAQATVPRRRSHA